MFVLYFNILDVDFRWLTNIEERNLGWIRGRAGLFRLHPRTDVSFELGLFTQDLYLIFSPVTIIVTSKALNSEDSNVDPVQRRSERKLKDET